MRKPPAILKPRDRNADIGSSHARKGVIFDRFEEANKVEAKGISQEEKKVQLEKEKEESRLAMLKLREEYEKHRRERGR